MNKENTIWEGRPSLVNTWKDQLKGFVVAKVVFATVLILNAIGITDIGLIRILLFSLLGWAPYGLPSLIINRFISYKVTDQKIVLQQGVINRRTDIIELYRVKDFVLLEPIALRVFRKSNLDIESSDRNLPSLRFGAIKGGSEAMNILRKQVELVRNNKKVREMDIQGSDSLELEALA